MPRKSRRQTAYEDFPWLLKGRRMMCEFLLCSPYTLSNLISAGAPISLVNGCLRAVKDELRVWHSGYLAKNR